MKFIIAAVLFLAVSAVNVKCKDSIYDPTKQKWYEYDLSPLHHDESQYVDTLWFRTNENNIYYVNFCGQTASACQNPDTSVCIRHPESQGYSFYSGGSTTTQKFSIAEDPSQTPGTSVTVTYSNGEKCGTGYYKTKMYVNCQYTANPGYFYNIDESDCEATLYMWSASGCGKEIPGPSSSSSQSDTCGGVVKDEKNKRAYKFDLSALHHDETQYTDPLWYRASDGSIYYVNFCGQTASACSSQDTSVCIRREEGSGFRYDSGGSTSSQTISIAEDPHFGPGDSVTVTYSNGAKCPSGGNYKTKIYVNCMKTAIPGYFYNITQTGDCEATLYMWSAAGCGVEVPYQDY